MEIQVIRCDCGHLSTPSGCAAGYATVCGTGKTLCYDCAYENDVALAKQTGKGFFYLTCKESLIGDVYAVTTWPGRHVSTRVRIMNRWRDNFGGHRVAVRFTMDNGSVWCGQGPGEGMYLRVRRTQLKSLNA